ncbi:uncharacterized protein EURHEDRAFT_390050 [Aspergillus ruber CBS 135680]|uniref:Uncharacterized protein n=1 Tax=Aspergillus ruber (strain CBS 135680) TaxID=1388766 RepID=A0A017S1Q1_ASPRC|nr:uncharacterized protein EURHEDRAFT_390050 [Aspergillus ruber CBS 135680]EYE90887.1 hypothetical protein EURHEDRAFT_390050 [Aspergillus ruber CBS 135680]
MPSTLADVPAYKAYLAHVPAGTLPLPLIKEGEHEETVIHVDELFCRVEDCIRGKKAFPGTNDLRYHVKHYHNVNVASPGTGRPKPEAVKVAVKFFKNIIEGPPEPVPSPSESTHPEPARATTPPGHAKPPFPLTKKGTVSCAAMQRWCRDNGHAVPCVSCAAKGLRAKGK